MSTNYPAEINSETGLAKDYTPEAKPARYRAKLDTLSDVRREMARLYRESRSGALNVHEATKHVWILKTISEVISEVEIENRILALEQSLPRDNDNEPR